MFDFTKFKKRKFNLYMLENKGEDIIYVFKDRMQSYLL